MDTCLSTYPGLKALRADVPLRAVAALTVIVSFDVFKHSFAHLGAAPEPLAVDALNLQAVKEALRTGIVVAVAFSAHAALQVMGAGAGQDHPDKMTENAPTGQNRVAPSD